MSLCVTDGALSLLPPLLPGVTSHDVLHLYPTVAGSRTGSRAGSNAYLALAILAPIAAAASPVTRDVATGSAASISVSEQNWVSIRQWRVCLSRAGDATHGRYATHGFYRGVAGVTAGRMIFATGSGTGESMTRKSAPATGASTDWTEETAGYTATESTESTA